MTKNQRCIQWTQTAKECYDRGCVCKECPIKDLIETHCFMKTAVIELVRKFGAPPEEVMNQRQQMVIDAILNGAETKLDIMIDTGYTNGVVQNTLNELYILAEQNGMYFPSKVKIYDFIQWVRGEYEG